MKKKKPRRASVKAGNKVAGVQAASVTPAGAPAAPQIALRVPEGARRLPEDVLRAALVQYINEHPGDFVPQDFVTALEPLYRELGYRTRHGDGQSILIVRDDAAGDFVCFSAFLRECRRLYPKAHITLLISGRNAGLTECCPYVDERILNTSLELDIPQGVPHRELLQTAEFAFRALLPRHFDLAFGPRLGIKGQSSVLMYLSGARERVSFTQDRLTPAGTVAHLGWDAFLTEACPFVMEPMHDAERSLSILEYMTRLRIADRSLEVWYVPQHAKRAREALAPLYARGMKRIYAVCPGGSIGMKRWPAERFAAVCHEIMVHEPETGFLLLGGPGDREASARVASALGDRAIDLTGEVPYLVSAAALDLAELYIGDDTSLLHVAAALGKPCLSVNAFPASLPMAAMSIPVRFAPYQVPQVTVLPREARDGCSDSWRHGCSHKDEPHCILGVEPLTVLRGYGALRERIEAGDRRPFFLR